MTIGTGGRGLSALILALIVALAPGTGRAQLVDDVLRTIEGLCAQLSSARTLDELRDRAAVIGGMARTLSSPSAMNPLREVEENLKSAEATIKTLRARQGVIDIDVLQLRGFIKGGPSESDIQWQTDKLVELQAKRLALHTGSGGQPGLDEIERRLARIAADRFEFDADRIAARAEKPRLEATRATMLELKGQIARDFTFHQNERNRLIAERDKANPYRAKIDELEKERGDNARKIAELQEKIPEYRQTLERVRLTASAMAVGLDDLKACAARREKELREAAKPPDPPKPPTPPTPPMPPPSARPSFAMAGTWSGRCAGFDAALGGPFNMTAASGAISGSFSGQYVSGRISGTVSPQGQLAAGGGNGSNLTVQWSGKIVESGGRWSGSGQWNGNSGSSACSGAWSSR